MVAEDKNKWQTGKVLDVSKESFTTHSGSHTTGRVDQTGNINATTSDSSWNHQRWTYQIEDDKYIYVLSHTLSFRWSKECRVIIGAPVQFEVKKRDGWIKDEDGRVHKLSLVKQILKDQKQ